MLSINCPQCGIESSPGMKFCGWCGSSLANICLECGFTNPLGYVFCGQCGKALSSIPLQDQNTGSKISQISETVPQDSPVENKTPTMLQGERRLATVVMTDVSGSTDLLERIGTEAWVEMMNHVLKILETSIYRYGGEVDQFRGNGLVAFFGASSANEDDPERAVLAAISMQQEIESYSNELLETEDICLKLRVGVNTGEVIVASIGDSNQYSEDTVMGEAVALAARMESAASPGTVLVSENTYRLVKTR